MGLFTKKKGRIKEKWMYNTKSNLLAGPVVYDVNRDGSKEIVLGTKDGRVIMMDENSNVSWIYDVKEEVSEIDSYFQDSELAHSIAAAPTISDIDKDGRNEVIFGTEMGILYALDNRGMILWKFKTEHAIRSSVYLHDINNDDLKEIIFGCMDGSIYVLSSGGSLLWKHEAESPIEGTPTVMDNKIIFGCHDGTLRCVHYKGELAWKHQTQGKIVAQPVVEILNGTQRNVIVGSTDFNLYALDENGALVWNFKTEGAILSRAAIADINRDGKKEVVFGSCDNNVYALTDTGEKIWSYETYFWVVAPPIIEDIDGDGKNEVIIGSYDHNIYVLDSEGVYALDYLPGLGGVVHQSGHYSELMTAEPGIIQAKKIWQYNTGGFIVGYALDKQNIVVNIKQGKVEQLMHEN